MNIVQVMRIFEYWYKRTENIHNAVGLTVYKDGTFTIGYDYGEVTNPDYKLLEEGEITL